MPFLHYRSTDLSYKLKINPILDYIHKMNYNLTLNKLETD